MPATRRFRSAAAAQNTAVSADSIVSQVLPPGESRLSTPQHYSASSGGSAGKGPRADAAKANRGLLGWVTLLFDFGMWRSVQTSVRAFMVLAAKVWGVVCYLIKKQTRAVRMLIIPRLRMTDL